MHWAKGCGPGAKPRCQEFSAAHKPASSSSAPLMRINPETFSKSDREAVPQKARSGGGHACMPSARPLTMSDTAYIFKAACKRTENAWKTGIYVGIQEQLHIRIKMPEKLACIRANQANDCC
eukprot:1159873-Pelagomonas_calceolata.AAC.5